MSELNSDTVIHWRTDSCLARDSQLLLIIIIIYYYLEFAKTVLTLNARNRYNQLQAKQSFKQEEARQAVQALLNMTPRIDK